MANSALFENYFFYKSKHIVGLSVTTAGVNGSKRVFKGRFEFTVVNVQTTKP